MYWLLDQGRTTGDANEAYWRECLVRRRRFIEGVLEMTRADDTIEENDKNRRVAALWGSLGRLLLVTPSLCQDYLLAWAADRRQWQRHVEQLSAGQDLAHALALLTRQGSPPLKWRLRQAGQPGRSPRQDVCLDGAPTYVPQAIKPAVG
jgi:hypothetical protein